MSKTLLVVAFLASSLLSHAESLRIRGKDYGEAELKAMYDRVRNLYVIYRNNVTPAKQAGAFRQTVIIKSMINPSTALVTASGADEPTDRPDGAKDLGPRFGREFTAAETNAALTADVSRGKRYALRLRDKATDLPLAQSWDLLVVDSKTFQEVEDKERRAEKLRVLYDVTLHFDDFISLLRKGWVFPELAGQ